MENAWTDESTVEEFVKKICSSSVFESEKLDLAVRQLQNNDIISVGLLRSWCLAELIEVLKVSAPIAKKIVEVLHPECGNNEIVSMSKTVTKHAEKIFQVQSMLMYLKEQMDQHERVIAEHSHMLADLMEDFQLNCNESNVDSESNKMAPSFE